MNFSAYTHQRISQTPADHAGALYGSVPIRLTRGGAGADRVKLCAERPASVGAHRLSMNLTGHAAYSDIQPRVEVNLCRTSRGSAIATWPATPKPNQRPALARSF